MSPSSVYRVTWYVNNKVTYILENITAEMVYNESVPGESLQAIPGNRWHVLMRHAAYERMEGLQPGVGLWICYQDNSEIEGLDTEAVLVEKL